MHRECNPGERRAFEELADFYGVGPRDWDGGGHATLLGEREYAVLNATPGAEDGPPGPGADGYCPPDGFHIHPTGF